MPTGTSEWMRLMVALRAVATSPTMPRAQEYVQRVQALEDGLVGHVQGGPEAVERGLTSVLRVAPARGLDGARVDPLRLAQALCTFYDDHDAALPEELVPAEAATVLVRRLHLGPPMGVVEQARVALELVDHPFVAALTCHLALRAVARGRDRRVLPELDLELEARLPAMAHICPFPPSWSQGGDAAGDSYHFWAQLCAGWVVAEGDTAGHQVLSGLFRTSPTLMRVVRGGVFGRTLFSGDHAAIDREAFEMGRRLGARAT